jgi:prepilin signal peptidase PulO-like enzyme (type II secretory pathway)
MMSDLLFARSQMAMSLAFHIVFAVVGIGMKITGQLREGVYVPFGPFLAGAGLVVTLADLLAALTARLDQPRPRPLVG